jgi:hypothetical protein
VSPLLASHKIVTNGFCNIKAGRHKKSQKELAKTRLLKLSKTSRHTFSCHKTESQMVTILTVTLWYLGIQDGDLTFIHPFI